MFSLGSTNVRQTHTHTHTLLRTHTHLMCVCVCVCVSLVCHSELCPYVTKHNHVLFILEREREGGQQSLSRGRSEGWKEGKDGEEEENWLRREKKRERFGGRREVRRRGEG